LHGRPPPEAEDYSVGRLLKSRRILSPPRGLVKINPEKFT
jgi:hypothetical protein